MKSFETRKRDGSLVITYRSPTVTAVIDVECFRIVRTNSIWAITTRVGAILIDHVSTMLRNKFAETLIAGIRRRQRNLGQLTVLALDLKIPNDRLK